MTRAFFLLLVLVGGCGHGDAQTTDELLKLLDKEVGRSEVYTQSKEVEIQHLKGNMSVATQLTDKYLSCRQVALAYSKLNSDSALYYLEKCVKYGRVANNKVWVQESVIQQAFVCADLESAFDWAIWTYNTAMCRC